MHLIQRKHKYYADQFSSEFQSYQLRLVYSKYNWIDQQVYYEFSPYFSFIFFFG